VNRTAVATGALAIIAVDQAVKAVVRSDVPAGSVRQVVPGVDLVYTKNTGVSFGLLNGAPAWVVGLISTVALFAVVALVFSMLPGAIRTVVATLMIGGALGNLVDRFALGYVTDYLDLPLIPPCNVADVAITFGAITMIAGVLLTGLAERQEHRDHEPSGTA
jgi:signal peptidase II